MSQAEGIQNPAHYRPEEITAYKVDNARRVRAAGQRGDAIVDGLPLKVTLELTADCDLFCKMCEFPAPREAGRRAGYALSVQERTFETLLVPQVFPHALVVNLTVVGEPLLVPYLDRVLELAQGWQTKIEFITHAGHLDAAMIKKIGPQAAGIVVSFDAATKKTFEAIRIGADFDRVVSNMYSFQRWRESLSEGAHVPYFHVNATLMKENVHELPALVRLAHMLGVDKVCGNLMIAFNEQMARSSLLRHQALANRAFSEARSVAERLGIQLVLPASFKNVSQVDEQAVNLPPVELLPIRNSQEAESESAEGEDLPAASRPPLKLPAELALPSLAMSAAEPKAEEGQASCRFLWNELFVSLSGDVAPCCIQGRPVVGNIHEKPLTEIWNGPEMQAMRTGLLTGNPRDCCRDCNYNSQRGKGDYREDTLIVPDKAQRVHEV